MVQRYAQKRLKKIYLLLFFNFLLLYACAGCAGAPGLAVVAPVLVFGGAALVVVACVSLVVVALVACVPALVAS